MQETPPLIITLSLDDVSSEFFNEQRRTHFPAAINYIDAHLTLFHKLPAEQVDLMEKTRMLTANFREFKLEVTGLQLLGRGVAYRMASSDLQRLHASLREIWLPHLTPQDLQPFRPHITVQNKVTPEAAKELLQQLSKGFVPFTAFATGIKTYSYLNGPWRSEESMSFRIN